MYAASQAGEFTCLRPWPHHRSTTRVEKYKSHNPFLPHTATSRGSFSTGNRGMAVLSTLRPTRERLEQLAKLYGSHRPIIQRFLTAGFVLYVLSTTYRSVSVRPPSKSTKGKEKARDESPLDAKKPPRVAVRLYDQMAHSFELSFSNSP